MRMRHLGIVSAVFTALVSCCFGQGVSDSTAMDARGRDTIIARRVDSLVKHFRPSSRNGAVLGYAQFRLGLESWLGIVWIDQVGSLVGAFYDCESAHECAPPLLESIERWLRPIDKERLFEYLNSDRSWASDLDFNCVRGADDMYPIRFVSTLRPDGSTDRLYYSVDCQQLGPEWDLLSALERATAFTLVPELRRYVRMRR